MTDASAIALRRRAFLAWGAGAGLGATLLPGALWAESAGGTEPVTAEMIEQAARLAGLEFPLAERERMVEGIRANLAAFEASAELDIDQSVAPPLLFDPVVPRAPEDPPRPPPAPVRPRDVERPARLEDVAFWPVADLAALIRTRQVSCAELTDLYLARMERLDAQLHAVVTPTAARARRQAEILDAELAAGRWRGPLHGIPWGAKDLIAVAGYPTTWGFEAYRDQRIEEDATVVRRLDAAGAVLVAKLATGEIARGDFWLGRRTRNPWKPDEGSGGSSAGPAAATAAGLVAFALGTDTLGSIVGPSRTCGITGLRPTFGRISRHGVMPVCWSLDKVGPMARSAEDCALVLAAIHGPDGADLAVKDEPFDWDRERSIEGLRVAYLASAFESEVRPSRRARRDNDLATLDRLRGLGVDLRPVELPEHADMDPLQMLLVDESAAFAELLRSGDVQYFRQDIDEPEDVLMRVARLFPAVEYVQVQRRRALLMRGMAELFEDVDVLVAPFGGSAQQSATSLTGHPSVSVPNGFDEAGRPTGIQFVGRLYGEAGALRLASACRAAAGAGIERPPGFA